MPVGIRLSKNHAAPNVVAFHTVWGETMPKALVAAASYCKLHELAGDGPDETVFAYDCLGGLRFEARRRDNAFELRKTP